jgi:hypothetical protein
MIGRSIPRRSRRRRLGQIIFLSVSYTALGLRLPSTGVSAAVDVQRLTRDEARCLEIEHGLDDFLDRANATHGVERREEAVRFG